MLSVFNKTEKKINKTIEEFNEIKTTMNEAFSMARTQRDELVQTKKELEEANQQLLMINEELALINKLIVETSHAVGGIICRKDKDGKYLFANQYLCEHFLKMDPNCSHHAEGKTDIDLINEYKERTGKEHTYGDVCMSTDEHCKTIGAKCLYVEFGYIDEKEVVLKMIKTPLYLPNGEDDGVVVFGWDLSGQCKYLNKELDKDVLNGSVEKLDDNVYWIKEKHMCNLPFGV